MTRFNEKEQMLRNSRFDGSHYALSALGVLLANIRDYGSVVFVSPNFDVVITINGAYLNIWQWESNHREYTAREVRSHAKYDSLRDMTVKEAEQWAKESYVWFMQSWFDITVDPSTLED